LVRHSQSGGTPDWSDTDKPLRAAPKLKPPALPGDTYSILKEAKYETLSASTVTEAMAFADSKERIDLLFTDLGLGDQPDGGILVAQEIAKARPGLPVLYSSGRGITNGMIARFVHPNGFLPKPYTKNELLAAIAKLI
jgi:DNA-binding NtrC family response regulator